MKYLTNFELQNPDLNKMNLYLADTTHYCLDIHNVIKEIKNIFEDKNKKIVTRFQSFDGLETKNKFDFLFNLKETNIHDLKLEHQNIIFKQYVKNNFSNLLDYYLFIHENYFCLLDKLQNIICKFFGFNLNVLNNVIYVFNPYVFLYNNKYIDHLPKIESYNNDVYEKIRKEFENLTKTTMYRKEYITID